jgi:hypothetical protein
MLDVLIFSHAIGWARRLLLIDTSQPLGLITKVGSKFNSPPSSSALETFLIDKIRLHPGFHLSADPTGQQIRGKFAKIRDVKSLSPSPCEDIIMDINFDTTWIGVLGGGASGSIIAGGSIYQMDIWNMGGNPLPARVLVKGKRVGAMAEVGAAHAILVVTGCRSAKEMDGIESSGLDWEFALGLKGSALINTGSKLFKIVSAEISAKVAEWAVHASAKRLVQWMMHDLGIVKPGRQFNLLPTPLSFAVGWGIFYEWQKLHLLGGKIGWQYISPKWYVESVLGDAWLQLYNIPEQDGEEVRIGFSIPEWGLDPYIRWEKNKGVSRLNDFQIVGYAYDGYFFERRDGMGYSGINLSKLRPVGRLEDGILSTSRTDEVKKGGWLKVRPAVFRFGNVCYWEADDTVEMMLDSNGCFFAASNGKKVRS